jgi:peptide/nickel transport system permease protein
MAEVKRKSRSQWEEIWRRLLKNKGAMIGMAITLALCIMALSADLIYDYNADIISQDMTNRFQAPGAKYPFGTDHLGRDIFKRIVYGSKYSISIGVAATLLSTLLGLVFGSIAGYFGGMLEDAIMRVLDVLGAIPNLLMGMVIVSALGANSTTLIIALAVSNVTYMSRIVRASVLTVRNSEYVESARAIGIPEWKIILKYIIPNCMSPIIVAVTLRVGGNIISASSLSFLGLGVAAPTPEWGSMLSDGRNFIRGYPYITLYPGLAIMITVLALNMFGDGLRDAMDPKLRR